MGLTFYLKTLIIVVFLVQNKYFGKKKFPGTLSVTCGVDKLIYHVSYKKNSSIPKNCSTMLISKSLPSVEITDGTGEPCVSESFTNLLSKEKYTLVFLSNGKKIHKVVATTYFYQINITEIGIKSFRYVSTSDLPYKNSSSCLFVDDLSNRHYSCGNKNCNCFEGTVSFLNPNTEYSINVVRNQTKLASINLTTASIPSISVNRKINALSFVANYTNGHCPTSCCYCCFNADVFTDPKEDCLRYLPNVKKGMKYCWMFSLNNLTTSNNYSCYWFDNNYDVIAVVPATKIPYTELKQLSFNLISSVYVVNTEVEYNSSKPCEFYSYDKQIKCDVDGNITTKCNCNSGKVTGLRMNSFSRVQIKQGDSVLAYNDSFVSGSTGQISLFSSGLDHIEYSVSYSENDHPLQTCIACIFPANSSYTNCQYVKNQMKDSIACTKHKFINLSNATAYRLLIHDEDLTIHTNQTFFTSANPINVEFKFIDTSIYYNLKYLNTSFIPTKCIFYFIENPSYIVKCQVRINCDCEHGELIYDNSTNYKALIIADSNNITLAQSYHYDINKSVGLSTTTIIGIAILAIIVIIIIVAVPASIKRTKKSRNLLTASRDE